MSELMSSGLMRLCTRCGELKVFSEFSRDKRIKSGYAARCKVCVNAQSKARHAANPEKAKAKGRAWREANSDRTKASSKAWREANPERAKANRKAWFQANSDRTKANSAAWRKSAKGRIACLARSAKHRAVKKRLDYDLDSHLEDLEGRLLWGECEATGLPFDLAAHGKASPFSPSLDRMDSGKGYVYDNIQIVCWAFNSMRGDWGDEVFKKVARAAIAKMEADEEKALEGL